MVFSTSSLQPALYGKKNVPGERDESWQMEGSRLLSQTRGGMVDEVVALGEGSSKGQWRCWAAPLISHIMSSRRAPSSCAPAPASLRLRVSVWKKLSDSDGLIILTRSQVCSCWKSNSSRMSMGEWMPCAPHSVLGELPPGSQSCQEHLLALSTLGEHRITCESKSNSRFMASCSALPGWLKTSVEEILCWAWETCWGLQEKMKEKIKIAETFCDDQ